MKCEKCGNEDLHVVSEYVELPKKKEYFITGFLLFLTVIFYLVGFFFLSMTISDSQRFSTPFFQTFGVVPTFVVLGIALYLNITYSFLKIFQPYEHATRLRFVCLKCGHSTILPIEVKENEPINVDDSSSST